MRLKFYGSIFFLLLCPLMKAQKVNHSLWTDFLQTHVSIDGRVNYVAIKLNPSELDKYLKLISETYPDETWNKNEVLAFWINAYNAFTIKLIVDNYPLKSIKDLQKPWNKKFIRIGSNTMTLNDIEHSILRKMNDPRIHFAIVCASISCPKLQNEAYSASNIELQLKNASREFLSDTFKNTIGINNLELSKIFQWYSKDFKQNSSLIEFLNQYTTIEISENAKIKFKDYNWNLNE